MLWSLVWMKKVGIDISLLARVWWHIMCKGVMCLRLPSKDTPYAESVIALFPEILGKLQHADVSIQEMYELALQKNWDTANFFAALDCLFALGRIQFDDERKVLSYAETDNL